MRFFLLNNLTAGFPDGVFDYYPRPDYFVEAARYQLWNNSPYEPLLQTRAVCSAPSPAVCRPSELVSFILAHPV